MLYRHTMNKNSIIYRMSWPMCSTSTVLRSACNELMHRNGIPTITDTAMETKESTSADVTASR
jgi:nicotinate-nucleotide pyrophosphorylase